MAAAVLAGCFAAESNAPIVVDVSLNSTEPVLGSGPVLIWAFLPELARSCPGGVGVAMFAFEDDGAFQPIIGENLTNVLSASGGILTRFPGSDVDSSFQFYVPNGTMSVLVWADYTIADPVAYGVQNETWHEREAGGWTRMPSQSATLHAPCAKDPDAREVLR